MTIAELQEQKTQLVAYLQSKVKAGDWHAVQDAASDIRELDAKIETLREVHETMSAAQTEAASPKWAQRIG